MISSAVYFRKVEESVCMNHLDEWRVLIWHTYVNKEPSNQRAELSDKSQSWRELLLTSYHFLTGLFESKEPYECFESDGSNRPRMKDNNLFFYLKNAMIHSSSSYKRDAGFDAR